MMPSGPWLTIPQVCKRFPSSRRDGCIDRTTVYRWIWSGVLPARRTPGGSIRVLESDLIDACRKVPGASHRTRHTSTPLARVDVAATLDALGLKPRAIRTVRRRPAC